MVIWVVIHDSSPLTDRILSRKAYRNRREINEGGTAYITPFTDEVSVKGIFSYPYLFASSNLVKSELQKKFVKSLLRHIAET